MKKNNWYKGMNKAERKDFLEMIPIGIVGVIVFYAIQWAGWIHL